MKQKRKGRKRDLIELAIVLAIFATIYLTGSQAEVFGRVQQVILKTGLMNAGVLEENSYLKADYHFKLIHSKGEILDLENLKGKTIFMNYWATWCPPCVAEMPGIHSLYEKVAANENIVFLMISEDKDLTKAVKWAERKGFEFPIYQVAGQLPEVYQTGSIPSTFVISPDGRVVVKKTGIANYNTKKFKNLLIKLAGSI